MTNKHWWLFILSWTGIALAEPPVFNEEGFRLATPDPVFSFPRSHGSHPAFRIEWWYFTGHLFAPPDQRFGFEATFFRYALAPGGHHTDSGFGTNQLYMAHMALTDVARQRFHHEERLNRDGWDAWAKVDELDIRNGNWTVRRTEGEAMQLVGSVRGDVRFTLDFEPQQDKVLFGKDGYSRKGASPGAASWYITFPRLAVSGTLLINGNSLPVEGQAWMDHEISTSQLDAQQAGWDWASVQLDDGRSVMVYILRKQDGTPDAYSKLTWIGGDGIIGQWGPDAFTWKARRTWTSSVSGATYPIDIDLSLPDPATGEKRVLRLRPVMDAQELPGELSGVPYWEAACDVLDETGSVVGLAYVELTGYAGDLGASMR